MPPNPSLEGLLSSPPLLLLDLRTPNKTNKATHKSRATGKRVKMETSLLISSKEPCFLTKVAVPGAGFPRAFSKP